MIKKIDHVNIVVNDLEAARDFFCRLGFSVVHQGDIEGAWISSIVNLEDVRASYIQLSLKDSGCNLELLKFHSPGSPLTQGGNAPNRIGIRHIAFDVDDIDTFVSSLKQDGVAFFGEVQTYPPTGKKLVYFHGPEGIILEFAQYT